MDLFRIFCEIPGSVYYPDSRIQIPLYPHYSIDLDKDGRVYLRHYDDDVKTIGEKTLGNASGVPEDKQVEFILEFVEEIADSVLTRIIGNRQEWDDQWIEPEGFKTQVSQKLSAIGSRLIPKRKS